MMSVLSGTFLYILATIMHKPNLIKRKLYKNNRIKNITKNIGASLIGLIVIVVFFLLIYQTEKPAKKGAFSISLIGLIPTLFLAFRAFVNSEITSSEIKALDKKDNTEITNKKAKDRLYILEGIGYSTAVFLFLFPILEYVSPVFAKLVFGTGVYFKYPYSDQLFSTQKFNIIKYLILMMTVLLIIFIFIGLIVSIIWGIAIAYYKNINNQKEGYK